MKNSNSKIKDKNYICISGWMVNQLNLKGNELIIYALIYGFSQDGETECMASLNYMASWISCSKQTVINVLNSLIKNELISKEQKTYNGVTFNYYKAILPDVKKFDQGSQNDECSNNNNISNSINDGKNNINIDIRRKKRKYGEYKNVLLSDDDLEKLKSEFPSDWKQRIERLSEYMEMYGKKYKSHYAVIRNWAKNDKQKKETETERERPKTIDVAKYDPYAKDPLEEKWRNGTITLEDLKAYDK